MKNVYSWFKRTKSSSQLPTTTTTTTATATASQPNEQLYGVTDELIDLIKTFTLETFKNFDLQDLEGGVLDNNKGESKDLSDWQEKHAILVLSKVKELSQLRFRLCPRYLKEQQFWRIYFTLVKNHVAKYELHAIRLEKLKQIEIENKKDTSNSGYEVEMLEARKPKNMEPETSLE
ncbi:BSD domain-containing protein [Tanacetum coccineum]